MSPRFATPLLALIVSCAPASASLPVAEHGVRDFATALHSEDPRPAYLLLAASARAQVSFEVFAQQWRRSRLERQHLANDLAQRLDAGTVTHERARAGFADGRRLLLLREGDSWKLDAALVTPVRAESPREAIRNFQDALARRDLDAALATLTPSRQAGIGGQLHGFLRGLAARVEATIDQLGADRAELRWEDAGIRYRVVVVRQGESWGIEDIHIRATPAPAQPTE
jgi:hypothetical protein